MNYYPKPSQNHAGKPIEHTYPLLLKVAIQELGVPNQDEEQLAKLCLWLECEAHSDFHHRRLAYTSIHYHHRFEGFNSSFDWRTTRDLDQSLGWVEVVSKLTSLAVRWDRRLSRRFDSVL